MNIQDLLRAPGLLKGLAAVFNKVRSEDYESLSDVERVQYDLEALEEIEQALVRIFQHKIINRLPRPAIVTAEELSNIASQQLAGIRFAAADCDNDEELRKLNPQLWTARERIIAFSNACINDDVESSGDYDLGYWRQADNESPQILPTELWKSENFSIFGNATNSSYSMLPSYHVYAALIGSCSNAAMEQAQLELKSFVETIGKTVRYSAATIEEQTLAYIFGGEGKAVFGTCLSACLRDYEDKDSRDDIKKNLQYALRCLVVADELSSTGLALSQCFAAIEALVCPKSAKKVEQISSYIPALLQPAGLRRTEKGDVLGRLYALRSRVVHGDYVQVSEDAVGLTRQIASGVIRCVVRWHDFQKRMEKETTQERFLKDLKYAAGDGAELVQIGVDLSMLLPDSENQKFLPPDDPFFIHIDEI